MHLEILLIKFKFIFKLCWRITIKKKNVTLDEKFAKWKGIPREEINWYPIIDVNKCVGCGMCITSCGRDVFDFDVQNKKAIVARPLQCMLGCTSCKVWCVYEAIRFPDSNYIREIIKKKKVLIIAKKQLQEKIGSTINS